MIGISKKENSTINYSTIDTILMRKIDAIE